jgi:hypothetical protein
MSEYNPKPHRSKLRFGQAGTISDDVTDAGDLCGIVAGLKLLQDCRIEPVSIPSIISLDIGNSGTLLFTNSFTRRVNPGSFLGYLGNTIYRNIRFTTK